ncbi:MAG: STAS domain-containing protein [Tractidigestivibacter sp.]|jgi:anti-sigma B factor antagonist|uniref:STAS domain-containing protein n=1 Tax=Tractidigestivibacter sp. TaxID=2847320 RepID=UPI003D90D4FE
MSIDITKADTQQGRRVSVSGEVDVSNASALREAITQELDGGVKNLAIDLSQVPYIDSTGIGVLVGAAHRAAEGGCAFSVERPQRNVARVLSLLGVGADLNVIDPQQ